MRRRLNHPVPEVFICLAAFLLAASGCRRSGKGAVEEVAPSGLQQEGWNSVILISSSGRLQARVQYGHMVQRENSRLIHFDEGVGVDFYDETGRHNSRLDSEKGIYDEESQDVTGLGRVVVVSDTGITLKTERLRWIQKKEKIVSDTHVVFIQEGDTLYGVGFESDSDLKNWELETPSGIRKKGLDLSRIREEMTGPEETAADSAGNGMK
ncbi:LPS export ABC transporter periplasmic protein LptC [bacterium]|nr:LPS export ABC transporter periplasmic protein LptC [bacterium]